MEKVTVIDSEKYQQYEQQIQQVFAEIEYLRKHQQAAPKVIYTNKDMLELLGVNVKTLFFGLFASRGQVLLHPRRHSSVSDENP